MQQFTHKRPKESKEKKSEPPPPTVLAQEDRTSEEVDRPVETWLEKTERTQEPRRKNTGDSIGCFPLKMNSCLEAIGCNGEDLTEQKMKCLSRKNSACLSQATEESSQ
jgi:hypothetical protein